MQTITGHSRREARSWLRSNPTPSALASNRFHTTQNALAFVERLYTVGAAEVLIGDLLVDSDGYPYADTLIVRVPRDGSARSTLERFCEEDGPGDVPPGDFTMSVSGDEIRLWWD